MSTHHDREKIETEDGSYTIRSSQFGESYHSIHGAAQETQHVYVEMGYLHRCLQESIAPLSSPIRILEMGLGTGLSLLLTYFEVEKQSKSVSYEAFELFPLSTEEVQEINQPFCPVCDALHKAPWNTAVRLSPFFEVYKHQTDFVSYSLPHDRFDVVYYDAFSPDTQPELWSPEIFEKLYASMRKGGVLTTYCAKGAVRRAMQSAGFRVERLAGPIGGKREILRATK